VTNDPIEYRTAPPPTLRHSPLAVAAFVISLFVPSVFVIQRVLNWMIQARLDQYWPKYLMPWGWAILAFGTELSFPVGLILGILAVMRRDYRRRLAVVACTINLLVLAALIKWTFFH
jgi:hypothetical protein